MGRFVCVSLATVFLCSVYGGRVVHGEETGSPRQLPATAGVPPARGGTPQQQPPPARVEEVVVTATKIETPIAHTAAAITTVTAEEIQRQQVTDTLELLRDIPGFTIVQTGSRGGTTSLFTRGGQADYNLVLVDGVKANSAGGFFDFSELTTTGIDRIEIVRGPQSALYGSDAISSVIQLFTPRGEGPARSTLRFRGGNFTTFEEHATVAGGAERYGYSLAAGRIDSDGFLKLNNGYGNTTLASRFDLVPWSALQVTSTVRYSDGRFHFPTENNGDRFGPFDPRQYRDRRQLIFGTRLEHAPTTWWQQTLQLGVFREERTFRDPADPVPGTGSASVSFNDERRLSADYTSHFFLPPVFRVLPTFTLGGYGETEHLDQKAARSGTISRLDPGRNTESGYSQLLLQWEERVFLTTGFRVDNSSTFGTPLSPRFSLAAVLPRTRTKLRAGYAEGIKAPSFSENFGTGSPTVVGNRHLKPEQTESWEIGLDQPLPLAWGEGLLSLTYFHADYDNLVAFVFGSTPNFLNIQRARSRGLEVGVRADPLDGLSLVSSYTYLNTSVLDPGSSGGTVFVKGKSLLRRPTHTGSWTFNYTRGRWQANLNTSIKGDGIDRDFNASPTGKRVTLDGYTKVDLALAYRLLENAWGLHALTLTAKVHNLFDEQYEEAFGFSSAGANFLVGFQAEF